MKKMLKQGSVIFVLCGILAACTSMNDLHDKYLKEGEIVYLAKFDSVKIHSGVERVDFEYWLSDPKGKNVVVLWNMGENSFEAPIGLTTPDTPGTFTIEEVNEGSVSFEIYVYDADFDERSIVQRETAVVYGEKYFESLNNRSIRSTTFDRDYTGNLIIHWVNARYDLNFGTEITYTTSAGVRVDTIARPEDGAFSHVSTLEDVVVGSVFSYRVLYRPSPDSELEFSSDVRSFTVQAPSYYKVLRQFWTFPGYIVGGQDATIGYSSQATNEGNAPQGRVVALLDDNTSTFWHSRWQSPASNYPHWFIIDMNANITVSEVELLRRTGNSGTARGFRLFTCPDVPVDQNDPVNGYPWVDHDEYAFDPTNASPQKFEVPGSPVARYIRMYFDTSHIGTGQHVMFAEFAVWTRLEE